MVKNRWWILGALGVAITGCGGGSGGGGGSTPSGNSLTQARSALDQMVTGSQQASPQTLQSTLTLFQTALQQNATSAEARFGAAICLAGLVGGQMTGSAATGGSSGIGVAYQPISGGSANSIGPVPPTPPGVSTPPQPAPPPGQLGLFWNLGLGVNNPYSLLNTLAPVVDLQYGLLPYYGYVGDDATSREQLLTDLNTVDQDLQTIEANPNFTETLPNPSGSGTVTVGLPEVYLFDSYVNSMRTDLALSLAYIRDIPGSSQTVGVPPGGVAWGANQPSTAPIFKDLNGDGKLEPNEYLPPSPYLTLRAASYLTTAQQALQAEATDETNGINGVFSRPSDGSGGFLIPNSSTVHAQLANIQSNVVPVIQQAATGPVTIQVPQPVTTLISNGGSKAIKTAQGRVVFPEVGGIMIAPGEPVTPPQVTLISVTFNLAAWFAHPPADLKVFAPTYPLDSSGNPILSQAVYPDPTFGGLFPNGLPSSLLF